MLMPPRLIDLPCDGDHDIAIQLASIRATIFEVNGDVHKVQWPPHGHDRKLPELLVTWARFSVSVDGGQPFWLECELPAAKPARDNQAG